MSVKTRFRKVVPHGERCCGCHTCETICSLVNDGTCQPAIARLRVEFDQFTGDAQIEVGPRCTLCGECIKWCPTQALSAAYSK
ncbi:MAG: hypothetical protein HYX96_00960 [Chloroflexi bacterium]|nr:hypothetical protein [Chloroflexota bacterium]